MPEKRIKGLRVRLGKKIERKTMKDIKTDRMR